ncbi:saccharopine dehydrogenase NADP-binding domain-containing protein [Streptomyces sp. Tue6028]|uniref:saccharopine dehydrogenase NADP-binding domain-containing protein n=1 Tax=Streptomyces sp. Tue6028 TaxID=2036037 RepID=UPI003D713CE0
MTARPIAVYGATGHTGRLVTAELAARGREIVLAGRNGEALHALASELNVSAQVRVAGLDDPDALRMVTENAAVVINCAGPYSRSGEPVASAALAARCHYLDHAAEPLHVKHLFDTFGARARAANTIIIPGMSFYGALADLLAALVANGLPQVDTLTVAYAVNGWRMTTASKNTALQLNGADRVLYTNGSHRVAPGRNAPGSFDFPAPIGTRAVLVDYPAGEVVTIPRHVPTRSVQVFMTADTFTEEAVFTSEKLDPATRAQSAYTVVVQATSAKSTRTGYLRGHDIYRTGAVSSVEAAIRLADNHATLEGGVLSASETLPPEHFLNALQHRGLLVMTLPTG